VGDVNTPSGRKVTLRAERAQVTRRRIADSARRLFLRDGYSATTIRGIAVEAGVAVQTVYAVYGSKAGILDALREGAMAQPAATAAFTAALLDPSVTRRVALFARSIRLRWELAGDVVAIHRDAAAAEPSVRAGVEETLRARRAGISTLARSLETGLRPGLGVERATAVLDAMTLPEVYAELVDVQGWTPDEFEAWLATALARELFGPDVDA
jgi:TetR/AcrR family transcriptional regulator, regulator of cefoperazone and chloramphenicol sensitivity